VKSLPYGEITEASAFMHLSARRISAVIIMELTLLSVAIKLSAASNSLLTLIKEKSSFSGILK